MGFVRIETWAAPNETTAARAMITGGLWQRKSSALLLTMTMEALLVAVLLHLGSSPPAPQQQPPTLLMMDVNAISDSPAAEPPAVAQPRPHPSNLAVQLNATVNAPVPQEWSVISLPPAEPATSAVAITSPSSPAANTGAGTGNGGRGSYDPYAFASYRPSSGLGSLSGGSVAPPAPALNAVAVQLLEDRLRRRLGVSGKQFDARLTVASDGRITHVELPSTVTPDLIAAIAASSIGFQLAERDDARAADAVVALRLVI